MARRRLVLKGATLEAIELLASELGIAPGDLIVRALYLTVLFEKTARSNDSPDDSTPPSSKETPDITAHPPHEEDPSLAEVIHRAFEPSESPIRIIVQQQNVFFSHGLTMKKIDLLSGQDVETVALTLIEQLNSSSIAKDMRVDRFDLGVVFMFDSDVSDEYIIENVNGVLASRGYVKQTGKRETGRDS